jgi:Mg2+ and Co2+ transporter CorA
VSGYFGIDLEVMPWLKETWGTVAAAVLMVSLAVGAFLLFRRRAWP